MTARPLPRILIADDHPLFCEALRLVVERVCPRAEFVEASGFAEMVAATAADGQFDLVFLDLTMPGGDVLAELDGLRGRIPTTPVIVVSAREDQATIRAVTACGVAGYLRKSASRREMEATIARVIACSCVGQTRRLGHVPPVGSGVESLTPRQAAVLDKLWEGKSNRQIAELLGIEEITVKVHISAILRKLGVKNRLAAVAASRDGQLSGIRERELFR